MKNYTVFILLLVFGTLCFIAGRISIRETPEPRVNIEPPKLSEPTIFGWIDILAQSNGTKIALGLGENGSVLCGINTNEANTP